MEILAEAHWQALRAAHEERVTPWIEPRLNRMSLGRKHPVEDFLFEYYPYRPAQLKRWHPGLGRALAGASAEEYLSAKGYRREGDVILADPGELVESRRDFPRWLRSLLVAVRDRPAAFGCFGMHEWAMVYRTAEVRHAAWPLRLSPEEIARTVEELSLRCTHYDAFRFFTPEARPLNKVQPTRESTVALEQAGCLHANMDLYKWAFKLSPYASSELVADAFELALAIRTLDMRASPYDLRALGYEPVALETPEGRLEYDRQQREFSARAEPLRARLIALCDALLAEPAEVV